MRRLRPEFPEGATMTHPTIGSVTSPVKSPVPARSRWLAWGAVAGPVLFTLAWLVLGFLSPGYTIWGTRIAPYSPISQPISGLGMGATAPYMNAAFILARLLPGQYGAARAYAVGHDDRRDLQPRSDDAAPARLPPGHRNPGGELPGGRAVPSRHLALAPVWRPVATVLPSATPAPARAVPPAPADSVRRPALGCRPQPPSAGYRGT